MSGVVAMFGDALAETAAVLRARLAERPEAYVSGAKVGARVPTDRDLDARRLPFVQVAVDGTPDVTYPVVARSTVRVTVWHVDDDQAHDAAQLAHGLVLAASTDSASFAALTGVLRAVDPASGCALASFTVRASTRGVLA
ncbi:MAG TPA: hypothetical protein VFL65_00845 [Jatrophihabitans sp.]|nr:hypothetical protein [Jatrophihabitans sp.]